MTRVAQSWPLRIVLLSALLACGGNEYAPPPPPEVTAVLPEQRDVTRFIEYTGTTRAVEAVEVRARVTGFLESMHFEAGDSVEEGDLLFVIDPEQFQIALQAAEAERTSAQAGLDLTTIEFERTEALYKNKATSEIKLINARARRDKAAAALASAEASVRAAQLDLEYAHVTAPTRGRVGRHYVDLGNLVGSSEATKLTDLIRYSPLYVYFYLSERDLLDLQGQSQRRREPKDTDYANRPPAPILVGRSNEDGYPHEGTIDFTALQVDPATGTFEVRGVLENEGALDEIIIPGTFVRVRVPVGLDPEALLVSERALGADQSGRFVLVVNDDDVVEQRRVEVGSIVDGMRVIRKGIRPKDWVVVNGLQRARPGSRVAPTRQGRERSQGVAASPTAAGD